MRLLFYFIKKYGLLTIAAFLYAVGLSLFLEPNHMVPGGVTGIAMLLGKSGTLGVGVWYFVLNVPLLVFGLIQFGLPFSLSGTFVTILISFFTDFLAQNLPVNLELDLFCVVVVGGVLCGVSMGMVFKLHTTTGGLDILVKYMRKKYPYIKTGVFFLAFDVIIIIVYTISMRTLNVAIYSCVVVWISSKIMNFVLYGLNEVELVYIISERADDITEQLLFQLGVGVTHLHGRGGFSSGQKKVILCAVKKRLTPEVEEIVRRQDREAFLMISPAREIYGEGFQDLFVEKV